MRSMNLVYAGVVMKRARFHGVIGAALLGMCLVACKDQGSLPEVPAPSGRGDEGTSGLPVLYDHRQLAGLEDLSGLERGAHTVELDVYAPTHRGWTPEAERRVIEGIQVLHVETGAPAETRVTFEPLGDRQDARRARLEMALEDEGSWVVILSNTPTGLLAAHADRELLELYDVREPEALAAPTSPGILLRTVGSCNHVNKMTSEVDQGGNVRKLRLHFSEALDPAWAPEGLELALRDAEGERLPSVHARTSRVSRDVLELDIPPGARGLVEIPLVAVPGLAGRFHDLLSCQEEDGSVKAGYLTGGLSSDERAVSPLHRAVWRAQRAEKE